MKALHQAMEALYCNGQLNTPPSTAMILLCTAQCTVQSTRELMGLCKTAPQCESHSVELIFAELFEKLLALCHICGQNQTKHVTLFSGKFSGKSLQLTVYSVQ